MNRTSLLVALALAAAVGLTFGLFPQLDLDLARPFFDPAADGFWGRFDPVLNGLREANRLIVTLLAAPAVLALIGKLVLPRRRMLIPGRAAVLMVTTLAIGPGIVTNSILKDHWGRSRPIDVMAFGGDEHFVPWWDPRCDCPGNCSFVAGEPSVAFWTLAPAARSTSRRRSPATAAALAFAAGIGLVRQAGRGHFFTAFVLQVASPSPRRAMHGVLFRWRAPAPATSDQASERGLEWLVLPLHGAVARRLCRPALPAPADPEEGGPEGG